MKGYFAILPLFALSALSCSRIGEEELMREHNSVEIKINARIAGTPGSTKTSMGLLDGTVYPVYWQAGDAIGLISGNVSSLEITGGIGTTSGTFIGKADDVVAPFPSTEVYPAAYPADKAFAVKTDESTLLVGSYLPYIQPYVEGPAGGDGTFDSNVYPMAAVSTDGFSFDFHNLTGIIQLQIKGHPLENDPEGKTNRIKAIYISGKNHEALAGGVGMKFPADGAGPLTADMDSRDYGMDIENYGSEAYERVILDLSSLEAGYLQLSPDVTTYINIAVIPQTFTNGFTLEMVDWGNGGTYTMESEPGITVKRSCAKRMQEFVYRQPDPLQVANSYIYEDTGYYITPAYCMGNRMDVELNIPESADPATTLLWSDMVDESGNLINAVDNIEYVKFSDGKNYVQYRINVDPATGTHYLGNAMIALYDRNTKHIYWTWHIWLTDQLKDVITGGSTDAGTYDCEYPDGSIQHYAAEASNKKLIIMDRNLGALHARPEECAVVDGVRQTWQTYGLYYQNGRRDPFIGGNWNGSSIRSTTVTYSNQGGEDYITLREDETSAFGSNTAPCWVNDELAPLGWYYLVGYQNVSTALAHPLTFSSAHELSGVGNGQWTDYNDLDNKSWLNGADHGTTGLSDGDHQSYWNRTKTIMDPCPVGYSVLGDDAAYFNQDTKTYVSDEANGIFGLTTSFTYNGVTYDSWWPAAGVRTTHGRMADVGYIGMYFHYDHIANTHGGHGTAFYGITSKEDKGKVTTSATFNDDLHTNHAACLRCVREKQFDTSGNPTIPLRGWGADD